MCDDIHATLAELRSKGVEVAREVSDQRWGLMAASACRTAVSSGFTSPGTRRRFRLNARTLSRPAVVSREDESEIPGTGRYAVHSGRQLAVASTSLVRQKIDPQAQARGPAGGTGAAPSPAPAFVPMPACIGRRESAACGQIPAGGAVRWVPIIEIPSTPFPAPPPAAAPDRQRPQRFPACPVSPARPPRTPESRACPRMQRQRWNIVAVPATSMLHRSGKARGATAPRTAAADPLGEGNSAATRLIRFRPRGPTQQPECFWGTGAAARRRGSAPPGRGTRCPPGRGRCAGQAPPARRWGGRQAPGAGQPRPRDAPSGPRQRLTLGGSHEVDPSWV